MSCTSVASCLVMAGTLALAADNVAPDALSVLEQLRFPPQQKMSFVQRQLNPLLAQPTQQTGLLWISAGQGLVMSVETPRAEVRTLQSDVLTMTRPRSGRPGPGPPTRTRQLRLDPTNGDHLVLLGIQALLLGDVQTLRRLFVVESMPSSRGWRLRLWPTSEAARSHLRAVTLSGEGASLNHLRADYGTGKDASSWMEIAIQAPPSDSGQTN